MTISFIQGAFCLFQLVFIINFLIQGQHCLLPSQIAHNSGGQILSLTDAARIIELAAKILRKSGPNQIVGENEDEKLERTSYWTCAKFEEPYNGVPFFGWGKEEIKKWQQKGFSERLCKNMYRLLATVDIEVLMFKEKLVTEVKNAHWLDLFFWKEKRVYDHDIQNFKMSRLFAFARNLTIRFLKFGNSTKGRRLLLDGPYLKGPFDNKSINRAYYLDLLRGFDKKTLELLQLMELNPKFRMSETESLWDWLKNKGKEVYNNVYENVNHKGWFQKKGDQAMLVQVYETMLLEKPVNLEKIGKSTIYETKKDSLFTRIVNKIEHNDETPANGMVQLYEQHPWYMPRIHKMVEIYAQVHMRQEADENGVLKEDLKVDEHKKGKNKNTQKMEQKDQKKNKEKEISEKMEENHENKKNTEKMEQKDQKKKQEKEIIEDEEKEHPKYWHLSNIKKHEIMVRKKLDHDAILEMLRMFDTEIFRELEKNTEKDAFRDFFKYEVENLGDWVFNEKTVKEAGEIIMEKVEQILNEYSLSLLDKQSDIPVRLGDELLSYEEVNVLTLAIFYKFAVHLASEYLKFKHPRPESDAPDPDAHTPATAVSVNVNAAGAVSDILDDVNKFFRTTLDIFHKEQKEAERTEPKEAAKTGEHKEASKTKETIETPTLGVEKKIHFSKILKSTVKHFHSESKDGNGVKGRKRRNVGDKHSMFEHAMQKVSDHVAGEEEINWQKKKPEAVEILLLYKTRLEELKHDIKNNDEFENLKSVILDGIDDAKRADLLLEDMTFADRFEIKFK